ncbi:MAG TPA: undecaprenyl-diphosphate phosphatase [Candidatus Paceibacterota bacterium]|nr:undecaprenyl-diphosphate phosphatase [Candidatus Paceibacterota bacterium]
MTIFQAVFLGLVEGVTEFIPVSSTGHLIAVSNLLGLTATDFLKTFEIVIQSAAILAVVILFWKRIWSGLAMIKHLFWAFVPTAIIGALVYPMVKNILDDYHLVIWTLIGGGILIILFERAYPIRQSGEITGKNAFLVGVAQTLAFIPGVSRSAATIIAGSLAGISRAAIVEFSFLLAIPTMFAATGYDVYKNYTILTGSNLGLLAAGGIAAFLSALLVAKWFLRYASHRKLTGFGWYRILVGVLFLFLLK